MKAIGMKRIFEIIIILTGITIFAVSFSAAQSTKKKGQLYGTVLEKETRQPVIGANILIEKTVSGAATDLDGRYSISNIETGTYIIKISCVGFKQKLITDVVLGSGHPTQINVLLEEDVLSGNEVLVQGSYFTLSKEIVNSSYGLRYEEIRRQAGAVGDVHRIIQSMPGVVPTNDQRNDLVVRGGSPSENLTIVDNVEVPNLSHFGAQGASGGPISMLSTEFIQDANFIAGGFSAQYGGKLSSVLNLTMRDGNNQSFSPSFDLSMAGAGIMLEGPIANKGTYMLSIRRSYLDLLYKSFNMTAIPKYSNFQLKATYNLDNDNKLWLTSIGGIDAIKFNYDVSDKTDPQTMNVESSGWRIINGINWQMLFGKSGYGIFCVSDALDYFDQNAHDPKENNRLSFQNKSKEGETNLKYDLFINDKENQFSAGASVKLLRENFDINIPMGTRSQYEQDSVRKDTMAINNSLTTSQTSLYATYTRTISRSLDLSLGVRYERFEYLTDKSKISPRVNLNYHISDNISASLAYGIYYQMPPLYLVSTIPQNKDLKPLRSDHYVMGFAYYPYPDIKMTIEGYYKSYLDYPVSLEYPAFSLANQGDEYTIHEKLIPMISKGNGRSRGLEIYIQKRMIDNFYGQISYSYSKTEHKALDGIYRPGSFDIPHVLSIITGYKLSDAWEFSGKFTYASGRPYTPIDMANSIQQNRNIFDVAKTNSERMPSYSRLDLRADYRANYDGWNLVTYMEIQNVYGRQNAFMIVFSEKTHELLTVKQIGFFPVGGIKIEF